MKAVLGAIVSTPLLAGVAFAQAAQPATPATLPTQCGAIAAAPTIPDGGHASAAQMHNADTAYRAWAADTEAKLHCRAGEIQAADAQVKAAAAEFQAQSANARQVSEAYNASIAAFNTRGASTHVNDRQHGATVSTQE